MIEKWKNRTESLSGEPVPCENVRSETDLIKAVSQTSEEISACSVKQRDKPHGER